MDWQLTAKDLKRYPHFDKFLPTEEIMQIIKDKRRVKENAFFPFIRYERSYQPFRQGKDRNKPNKKTREIRYASRRDAYIFSYYRHLLSQKYEEALYELGIDHSVIAYRKVPVAPFSNRGKCNIDFAKDAFDVVKNLGCCTTIVMDISKYFESLDHSRINDLWCRLFGFSELPPDHGAVFKNITQYRVVDRMKLYERLGYFGLKEQNNGVKAPGYLVPFKKVPSQICSTKEFREKVVGGSAQYPTLIEKNDKPYGIPQGAPISDIIANFYLLDFDCLVNKHITAIGGFYMRYSDDIIVIFPGTDLDAGHGLREFIRSSIHSFGDKIQIKQEKCSMVTFARHSNGKIKSEHLAGSKGHNGIEYLGFRFDGENVFLKDGTLSSLYRKISLSVKAEVHALVARYPGKDASFLKSRFKMDKFVAKFGRVKDFDLSDGPENWTFWTYARRAYDVFGEQGINIVYQLKRYREIIQSRVDAEIAEQAPST